MPSLVLLSFCSTRPSLLYRLLVCCSIAPATACSSSSCTLIVSCPLHSTLLLLPNSIQHEFLQSPSPSSSDSASTSNWNPILATLYAGPVCSKSSIWNHLVPASFVPTFASAKHLSKLSVSASYLPRTLISLLWSSLDMSWSVPSSPWPVHGCFYSHHPLLFRQWTFQSPCQSSSNPRKSSFIVPSTNQSQSLPACAKTLEAMHILLQSSLLPLEP